MKHISLNLTEKKLTVFLARKRYEYCRQVGAEATIYHKITSLEAEIDSFGAEVAYCKMMNVYPDTDYTHFAPFDAVVNGKTVDVKYTRLKSGRLLVKVIAGKERPDKYALMTGNFPNYTFVGEIDASIVLDDTNIDYRLPSPAYAISQSRLAAVPRTA